MPVVVDLSAQHCQWCGMNSDDVRVFTCPACGRLTCYECVRLQDEGTYCAHTTPKQRKVLTHQEWT